MAKYSFEFKKTVVMAYLNRKGGYVSLAKQYGIPAWTNIKKWVLAYQKFGDAALCRSRQQQKYTFEYKLHVVKLYLSSEVSYQELAIQEGISNPAQICKWVNDFQLVGPDALRPKKKGRKKSLNSSNFKKKVSTNETVSVDTSEEHVKQLEDELLKLRIENAYLKELRRLRLEEEALLKKQRESSTASEESLN
ncbi:MAG: transposase [Firmicutes bacterium]|nr:transposase [Bacillota bacterium]